MTRTSMGSQASEGAPAHGPAPQLHPSGFGVFAGKRQLRNLLLDRLQVRYTAVIVLISAVLTGGLGYFVFRKAHEASETVMVTLLDKADDPSTVDSIQRSFQSSDRFMLFALIGFGLILCVVLTLYGIAITHKVAGPLYKISHYFASIRDHRLGNVVALRRGDQLQEFFDHFREMHDALRRRTEEEVAILAAAIAVLEASAPTGEAARQLEALRALKRGKEESLNG